MEVKYSQSLIPVPQGKGLRKAQCLCYVGCFSAHVPLDLQYTVYILVDIPSVSLSPKFK